MNSKLRETRRKFLGQKAKVTKFSGGNNVFGEGVHTFTVVESKLGEKTRSDVNINVHQMRIKCVGGEDDNKVAWPFAPNLDDIDGIISSGKNIAAILGDVLPGGTLGDGEYELDIAAFLEVFEGLAAQCIGELIEVKVVNQKTKADGSHLKADGTPWQNFFILRGLGEDAKGVDRGAASKTTTHDASDNLDMGASPHAGTGKGTKKVVKKKATKKKAVKKKAVKKKVAKKKVRRK